MLDLLQRDRGRRAGLPLQVQGLDAVGAPGVPPQVDHHARHRVPAGSVGRARAAGSRSLRLPELVRFCHHFLAVTRFLFGRFRGSFSVLYGDSETRFEFVAADGQPAQPADEIWPSSGRWWLPNLFPRIGRLAEIDPEVCDNFRWKCGAPLACTMVQLVLVGFTFSHLTMLAMKVNANGWGENLELRDVTRQGLQSSPVLKNTLDFFFGSKVVGDPIMGEDTIGTISEKWSQCFAAIQHAHAMLVRPITPTPSADRFFLRISLIRAFARLLKQMMISFSLFISGCHDWLIPDDLAPLPRSVRNMCFRVDSLFFLLTVNPPLLRCLRVSHPPQFCSPKAKSFLLPSFHQPFLAASAARLNFGCDR